MQGPDEPVRSRTERGRGWRSGLLAAGAAFGMTAAGLGIAGAQTGSTTTTADPTAREATAPAAFGGPGLRGPGRHMGPGLAAAATAIGISEAELHTALASGQSIAQVAQSRNVTVAKVVDAMVAEARANITELVNRTGAYDGPGPGRHMAPGLAGAATAIGISEAELHTALASGQSIAQVAQSRNVTVAKVVDAMVADAKAKLADAVKAGDLTQAQADERATNLVAHITELVNHTGGPGHRGPRPPMS